MSPTVLVFLGGGIGSVLRYGVTLAATSIFGIGFPVGTLTVNIVGSFVMGLFAAYFAPWGEAALAWRLLFMTGVMGGFTTFSAFSLDTAVLYERGQSVAALLYVAASNVGSITALFLGLMLLR